MKTSNKRSIIPGIIVMIIALLLFVLGVYETLPFPPEKIMHYIILIFTLLGINFGISSGKKFAYNLHDKELLLKRIKGTTLTTFMLRSFMRNSIIFTSLTVLIWSIFIITASLLWTVFTDELFIGEIRWLMIFSMVLLIYGSYLLYKNKSAATTQMLTFTGKKIEKANNLTKKATDIMDNVEQLGKNTMKQFFQKQSE